MTDVAPSEARRFLFSSGTPPGETALVRNHEGRTLFTYRGFASIVGVVGALVAATVLTAGAAAVFFLAAEDRPAAAAATALLSACFASLVAMLVPPISVSLCTPAGERALTIAQLSAIGFPKARYIVSAADGEQVATLEKHFISRFGRNRWKIAPPHGEPAWAFDETWPRAILRKVGGKFDRRLEANVRIVHRGADAATIIRRPDESGAYDALVLLPGSALDARAAIALATVILGAEP